MSITKPIITKSKDNRITIRLNSKEYSNFCALYKKYKSHSMSYFIKQLIFREIKPYLDETEKELIRAYIVELNALGRNLNQLLKYKAYSDAENIVEEIKNIIKVGEELL